MKFQIEARVYLND